MLRELYTFLEKVSCIMLVDCASYTLYVTIQAVPDTRLTLKKYTGAKVEFLVRYNYMIIV